MGVWFENAAQREFPVKCNTLMEGDREKRLSVGMGWPDEWRYKTSSLGTCAVRSRDASRNKSLRDGWIRPNRNIHKHVYLRWPMGRIVGPAYVVDSESGVVIGVEVKP